MCADIAVNGVLPNTQSKSLSDVCDMVLIERFMFVLGEPGALVLPLSTSCCMNVDKTYYIHL